MDENTNPLRNVSLYVGLIVIAVVVLLTFGAFKIYQARSNKTKVTAISTPKPTPANIQSKNNPLISPSPSPSATNTTQTLQPEASPVLGANNQVAAQPESGSETTQVKGAGIAVISPERNSSVNSPVNVSGMANVLGDLKITVKDSNGRILGTGTAQACLGTQACPFAATVYIAKPQTAQGTVEVSSPQDSSAYTQTVAISFN